MCTKLWLLFHKSSFFYFKFPVFQVAESLSAVNSGQVVIYSWMHLRIFPLSLLLLKKTAESQRSCSFMALSVSWRWHQCSQAVVMWPTLVSTEVNYFICPQLWSLLLTGIRHGACVPTSTLGTTSVTWEDIWLFPRLCKSGRGQVQGCKAARLIRAYLFFRQWWRTELWEALWIRSLLFSILKTMSLGFIILSTPHKVWYYHENHSCRVMVASCLAV